MQPSLKRPRPPLAPGGSTLNMILADVTSLYSSIKPSSRLVHGAADDAYDVAALLGFRRKGLQRSPVPQGQTELCRNMRCAGRGMKPEFEEDKRHGDRICLHCGATSRLQPEREERCYVPSADDEPDENEESRQHGLGRAHGGIYKRHRVSNLMIADGFAGGLSDLGEEEQRRLMAYKGWIGSLTSHSYSDGHKVILPQVKVSALKLAEQLVCSQAEHCRRCDKPSRSNCRLAHKSKDTAVVAVSLIKRAEKQDKWIKRAEKQDKWIKRAEKQGKWAHTFKELVSILQADPTSKTVNLTRAKIGKITRATHELLCCGSIKREVDGGFGMYSCAADPDYKLKGGLVTNVPPDGAAAECHV